MFVWTHLLSAIFADNSRKIFAITDGLDISFMSTGNKYSLFLFCAKMQNLFKNICEHWFENIEYIPRDIDRRQ